MQQQPNNLCNSYHISRLTATTYPVQQLPHIPCNSYHISFATATTYPAQQPLHILCNSYQISNTTAPTYPTQQLPYILHNIYHIYPLQPTHIYLYFASSVREAFQMKKGNDLSGRYPQRKMTSMEDKFDRRGP